jgi:hypothetical protein
MQQVLSNEFWKTVRMGARKARSRQAAIAYVTKDLLGFQKGDKLIVNASRSAITSGETDVQLLRKLHKRGVHIYDCETLHAKVVLLDDVAFVGSGNMSSSSANALIEVGVLTNHRSTVSGVASFLEQLFFQSKELHARQLTRLCQIKVIRRGGWLPGVRRARKPKITRLGNGAWLVGVRELMNEPPRDEQEKIDRATEALRSKTGDADLEPNWIRWVGKNRFRQECREGDSVIQIWSKNKTKRPSSVYRSSPVLLKQSTKKWTRFYFKEATGQRVQMSWGRFKVLLKELGYPGRVGATSTVLLDPDLADAIDRKWRAVAKS